jgi:hypothetical protein
VAQFKLDKIQKCRCRLWRIDSGFKYRAGGSNVLNILLLDFNQNLPKLVAMVRRCYGRSE